MRFGPHPETLSTFIPSLLTTTLTLTAAFQYAFDVEGPFDLVVPGYLVEPLPSNGDDEPSYAALNAMHAALKTEHAALKAEHARQMAAQEAEHQDNDE